MSFPNESILASKNYSVPKLNLSLHENIKGYYNANNRKITEERCLDKASTLSDFSSEKTLKVWEKLKESCKSKSRTHWEESLENSFFLKSLTIEKKPTNWNENSDAAIFNLKRCSCKDVSRETNKIENEDILDAQIDNNEECCSPCLCPKYFISKSGLVFASLEEVSCGT